MDTVVHAAFFTSPKRDASYSHELESIRTLTWWAAAAGGVAFLMRSFTAVYGASQNPNFLSEDQRPARTLRSAGCATSWKRSSVRSFAKRYPADGLTVLASPPPGAGVPFYSRIFASGWSRSCSATTRSCSSCTGRRASRRGRGLANGPSRA